MTTDVLNHWFQSIEIDDAETIKLEFALAIDEAIRNRKLSRKAVADSVGSSPAWVTKVLRGDVNLTIESMAKLCKAVGHRLNIRVSEESAKVQRHVIPHTDFLSARLSKARTTTSFEFHMGGAQKTGLCNDKEYAHAA